MKLTLEKQIPLGFTIAILPMLIITFFAFRSMNSLRETLKWEKHTQQVLLQLDEVLVTTVDAETSGRGFLITGDEPFLEPYNQAQQKIDDSLAQLQKLVTDNPRQLERMTTLKDLVNQRFILLRQAVEMRRTQSLEIVRTQFVKNRGKDLMDQIRLLVKEMKDEEHQLLVEREAELEENLTTTYRMLYLIGSAGVFSIGLASLAIFREIGRRRKAEGDLRDANKDLENRVEKRTNELSIKNEELIEEIEKRKNSERAREELLKSEQIARRDAEVANRLRDEFLATVSHELRAPLSSILGWSKLLERGNLDEKTSQKALETIVRNAEVQNHLIEDLLDVSRIISGKLRLEPISVKPINFVEAALETVRPAAVAKSIDLDVIEIPPVSDISGDPNRLQQVIWNLLSNAIKFTPNGGRVSVEIAQNRNYVEIKVKDTGIGISKEFLPHVFDRFRQADSSSIRKFGGLGLGLAIVRHLTEMHGGTVSVLSDGENQGSTFIVSLPAIAVSREEKNEEALLSTGLENPAKVSLDGLLILVVDDEEDARQLLVHCLTFYGATVITAKSAAEGLSEIKDKSPDVLVSDIGMPDEDGYSLIRQVRNLSDEHQRNITAIALTAFTSAQDRIRALSSGYQNHVGKPVESDELATVIASLTRRLQTNESNGF